MGDYAPCQGMGWGEDALDPNLEGVGSYECH